VRYLPPYEFLKAKATTQSANGQTMIQMTQDDFIEMMRAIVVNVDIDEGWYLRRYPDVAEAVRAGTFKSAKDHFVNNGFFEGRMPFDSARQRIARDRIAASKKVFSSPARGNCHQNKCNCLHSDDETDGLRYYPARSMHTMNVRTEAAA